MALRGSIVVVAAAIAACADPSGPATHDHAHRLLIAGTEDGAIVVDLDWRGIVRRSGPRFVVQGPSALGTRSEVITVGRLESTETVMAGLDVETGFELWRTTIAQGLTPSTIDGVLVRATLIAANPSRPEVFLWPSVQNGVTGIAGYNYDGRRISRFLGPVSDRFRQMTTTPATTLHPEGCLVMAIDSGSGEGLRAFLHKTCGTSYSVRDSADLPLPSRVVLQMETSIDGRSIVVMTDSELLKVDAVTLEVRSRATRPLHAPFFYSRGTGRLIIADVGSAVVASSGIIYLLDAELELSSIIDLRPLPFGQRPLGILGAEESADGRWLYLIGGIPRDGPAYGPEQTHVVVIEKTTGEVVDLVMLETFGGGRPILVP